MNEFNKYWFISKDYQLRCVVLKNKRTDEYFCKVQLFALIGDKWQPVSKKSQVKVLQTGRGRSHIVHRFGENFKHIHNSTMFYIEDLKDLK